ncbi:hypothetical protein ACRAWD_29675 [Caulobacter segnis]
MSITGVDSIELNNTLQASMDADSPGGAHQPAQQIRLPAHQPPAALPGRRRGHVRQQPVAQVPARRQEALDDLPVGPGGLCGRVPGRPPRRRVQSPATTPTTSSRTASRPTGPTSPAAGSFRTRL